jgi:hypothetical protein
MKYDGDNVIAKFQRAEDAVKGVRAIHADVAKFNVGKEKDFQIRIKLGMAVGEVLIIGHDIVGDAWEDCCLLGEDTAEVGEVLVTESVKTELGDSLLAKQFLFESRETDADDDGRTLKHFNLSFEPTPPETPEGSEEEAFPSSAVEATAKESDGSYSSNTSLSNAPPMAEPPSTQSSLSGAPSLGSINTPSAAAVEAKKKREAKAAAAAAAAAAPGGADSAVPAAEAESSSQSSLAGLPSLGSATAEATASSQSSLSGAPPLADSPKVVVKDSSGIIKRSSIKGTRGKIANRVEWGEDQVKSFMRGDILAPPSPAAAPETPPTPKFTQPPPSIVVSSTPTSASPAPAPAPAPDAAVASPAPAKPAPPPSYNLANSSSSDSDDSSGLYSSDDDF